MLCNAQKNKGLRVAAPGRERSLLVDGFLEALPCGEGRDGLGGNLDLLTAGGAAPGPRLSLTRQEGAEADDGDALAARDVGDDRFEHRVDRVARRRFAEIAGLRRNLDQIRLGDHVWHVLSLFPPAVRQASERASYPNRAPNTTHRRDIAHVIPQTIMITPPRRNNVMSILRKLALTALAGCAFAPPAHAQSTLTMSSWVSPQHHLTSVVLQGFGDEVEKASGGRLKFQMLPKHPSVPPGTFDAVRDGLVDVSYVTASYTPARHVLPLVAELPGAGETAEINSVAYNRIHWKLLHKAGEYKGVHQLGVLPHGHGQRLNTKRPIKPLADLQGMKI